MTTRIARLKTWTKEHAPEIAVVGGLVAGSVTAIYGAAKWRHSNESRYPFSGNIEQHGSRHQTANVDGVDRDVLVSMFADDTEVWTFLMKTED